MSSAIPRPHQHPTPSHRTIDSEGEIHTVLNVLDDTDCRRIVGATTNEAMAASEVSEACDLPLSTTYRKLDMLTDAGLLAERTRIRRSGKHTSEYVRIVDEVMISMDETDGFEIQVSPRDGLGSAAQGFSGSGFNE